MALNLTPLLIQIIVSVIVIAPVLWLVGRGLVGKDKAKFTDAIWIVALGVVIGTVIGGYVHGLLGMLISLVIWLALIKHFFDCGWGKAFLIAIVAIVVLIVIAAVLAILGLAAIIGLGFFRP